LTMPWFEIYERDVLGVPGATGCTLPEPNPEFAAPVERQYIMSPTFKAALHRHLAAQQSLLWRVPDDPFGPGEWTSPPANRSLLADIAAALRELAARTGSRLLGERGRR
jgi:hypothetical protein